MKEVLDRRRLITPVERFYVRNGGWLPFRAAA
jgi:hypothetical protein